MSLSGGIPIIGDLLGIVEKAIPDTAARDQAKAKLQELEQVAIDRQGEITAIEAQSPSLFKSGWRPAVGWIVVSGLALHFIVFPIVSLILQLTGHQALASPLDVQSLIALLGALLGLGGLRTFERVRGKA